MDYTPVIEDLKAKCESCHIGKARKGLELVQAEFGCGPEPSKPKETQQEPVKAVSTRNKPSRSVSNPPHATSKSERSADGKSKVCHGCRSMMTLDRYPKNRGCSDGHAGTCSECTRTRAKKWWAETQKRKKAAKTAATGPATDPGLLPAKTYKCGCGKSFATRLVFTEHQQKCGAA